MTASRNVKTISSRLALVLVGLHMIATGGRTTLADHEVLWGGPEQYTFRVTHLPDLDQKRTALPNGGTLHCMPTSSINWAVYFANHGLPQLPPGPGYYGYQVFYPQTTAVITTLGFLMGTSPPGGTNKHAGHAGLASWLGQQGDNFVVWSFLPGGDASPTARTAHTFALGGAYVILGVGWYLELTPDRLIRQGGHAVCLASGARSGDQWQIGIRDPGSDEGDNTIQSPFTTETYDIEHRYVARQLFDEHRWMSRIIGYGGGGVQGYIDSINVIIPTFALTTSPTEPGIIQIHHVPMMFGSPVPPIEQFATPQLTEIRSFTLSPDGLDYVFIADDPDPGLPAALWRLDPLTGQSRPLQLPLNDPKQVMVGRLGDLFVMDGDDLARVNVNDWPPVEEGRTTPPAALSAMAYDDETDELVMLSTASQQVIRLPYHFDGDPDIRPVNPPIPLAANASICWDVNSGVAWTASAASSSLFRLTPAASQPVMISQEFTHPVLTESIDAVDVGDNGHLFVSCAGMLREFEVTRGGLVLVANPLFSQAEAGALLFVARSRTNYLEDQHSGEEWYDVLPDTFGEPIEECVADVNSDGWVDVLDLLALLAAWGPCPGGEFCHEDIDYSGVVDVLDLLAVLAAWGPCQPIGACCLADGTCEDLTANDCALRENSTWNEAETCGTFTCPPLPTGACCVYGDCVATSIETECVALGGLWYVDVDCSVFNCPTGHCAASGQCSGGAQYISRVQFGWVDKSSFCAMGGYADYTSYAVEVAAGYGLDLVVQTANAQPGDVCGVWIDWDQDYIFESPHEFVATGDISNSYWNASIGAPLDARPGPTRMRICLVNDGYPYPCGSLGPGEVEDYTVIVVDLTYCRAESECDQYISRVQFGDIDHPSDCPFGWGYSDFTYHATNVTIGEPTALTVTATYADSGDECAAWIDWNRDLDFDDPGEAISLSGSPGTGPYTAMVTPPPGSALGETRLRIRSVRDHEPLPCGEQSIGETEDYTVIVSGRSRQPRRGAFSSAPHR